MAKEVIVTANKIKKRKHILKIINILTFAIFASMLSVFIVLNFVYNGGKLSINLQKDLTEKKGIVLYDDSLGKNISRKLFADDLQYMDNISINWLPKNIDNEAEGSHNGDNYIAYTFFLENQGEETINYWYTVYIDDVIKNVDEAIRVIIYRNGEKTVYAKLNSDTNEPEKDSTPFHSDEIIAVEQAKEFKAGDVDKFTMVVFLEGDDPDCINQILGGEIKLHMEITGEPS